MEKIPRSVFLDIITGRAALDREENEYRKTDVSGQRASKREESISSGLAPYKGAWGQDKIMHLLRRTLFGATQSDYTIFSKLDLNKSLDLLLCQSPDPSPPLNAYGHDGYTDPDIPYGQTWVTCDYVRDGQLDKEEGLLNYNRMQSLTQWWVSRLLCQDSNLTEKMTLFWHNHMSAEFPFIFDAKKAYSYASVIRLHSLGNFKKLFFETVTSSGMLFYLSNDQSTPEAPNENLGREMQELFAVGKGKASGYTQDDVMAASRVLTGWITMHPYGEQHFAPERHDAGDKTFSAFYGNKVIKGRTGQEGREELDEMIDMIFATKEVSRHLCRSLYRWFIYSKIDFNTEDNIIEPLSDILIDNNYEITPVLRALLGSEHFFDNMNIGSQIKNPIDYLIGFCRQFRVASAPSDIVSEYQALEILSRKLNEASMCPGYPPNVAGWPAYYVSPAYDQLWINSDSIVSRYSAIDSLLQNDKLVVKHPYTGFQFDILTFTSELPEPSKPEQLVADSILLFSPVRLRPGQLSFLQNILSPEEEDDSLSWTKAWNAYTNDKGNAEKKAIVMDRLQNYYTYALKLYECQLM